MRFARTKLVLIALALGGCAALMPAPPAPSTLPAPAALPALAAPIVPATPPPVPREDLVVIVPATDAKVGTVAVQGTGFRIVLDHAYAAARNSPDGSMQSESESENKVREIFAAALAAQPPRPISFTLYFARGRNDLSAPSKRELARVRDEFARRPAAELTVIDHADAVASNRSSDAPSLQRAMRVKAMLVALGIPSESIRAVAHGKREPLVPAATGGADPRNPGVEVSVR